MATKTDERIGFNHEQDAELIERARALRPLLQEHATQAEQDRKPTAEAMQAMEDAGLCGVSVPRRWGGLGLSSNTWGHVGRELAKGDPSMAWSFFILNGGAWIASLTSDALQEELFADGIPKVAGGVSPGTLTPVKGGYLLNGRWGYNSVCQYRTWGMFNATIVDPDGTETMGASAYLPHSEIEIEEDWGAIGMRGTGSHSSIVKDAFIPEHRVVHPDQRLGTGIYEPDKKHVGEPSDYWTQMYPPRGPVLGVLIGAAEAALELVTERAQSRSVAYTSYTRQADSPVVQRDLARAAAAIESAVLIMDNVTRLMDELAVARQPIAYEERCRNRGQIGFAVDLLVDAVDKLMSISGSSGFMETNPLQRYWRDLNTAARHGNLMVNVGYEMAGRCRLGVEEQLMPEHWI